jgi:PTH1 family peptidyl-tRNA hydrolase
VPRLVVGLGNPGPEYEWTPHNLGFHALDALAGRLGTIFGSVRSLEGYGGPRKARVARAGDALLVQPQSWMNLSGDVVVPLARFWSAAPEEVLVVYDDLDLPLGALRIRPHGGAGGHNGMRSILARLGSDRFPRLRVGVGRPRTDAARHVLTPLSVDDRPLAERAVARAAEALEAWVGGEDIDRLMTRFHSRWTEGPDGSATGEVIRS